jgi:hypothetical protein
LPTSLVALTELLAKLSLPVLGVALGLIAIILVGLACYYLASFTSIENEIRRMDRSFLDFQARLGQAETDTIDRIRRAGSREVPSRRRRG